MTEDVDIDLTGHCYCGAVNYRVRIPAGERPLFSAYCHCDSCRRAHAAPLYHIVAVVASAFEITEGAELIEEFHKPGARVTRAFCRRCGSKVRNRFPGWQPEGNEVVGFFPATLEEQAQYQLPAAMRAQQVNRPQECVLDWDQLLGARAAAGRD